MSERLVGRGWWREAIARWRSPLGTAAQGLALVSGTTGAAGCANLFPPEGTLAEADRYVETHSASGDIEEHSESALGVQRRAGWAVEADGPLEIEGAIAVDAAGGQGWRDGETLAAALAPARPDLVRFYVPTLFQSLAGPDAESLRAAMMPALTPPMNRAYAIGRALRSLFEEAGFPSDTAVVVDLRGEESVALAAAIADRFDPVFDFDNWPHPAGVVPSHQTLAAALYYRPLFERARLGRAPGAAPLFVLDADRLTPYEDDGSRFDNRYLARLPAAPHLGELGVRHVLYVTDDGGGAELDDLNAAFVGYEAAGIDVRRLALADFAEEAIPDEEPDDPDAVPNYGAMVFYWGGDPLAHACFWDYYGWYAPVGGHAKVRIAPPVPARVAHGFAWRVSPRAVFSPGLAGLGRVTLPASRATGMPLGPGGRSGSFGRFHAGFGGG